MASSSDSDGRQTDRTPPPQAGAAKGHASVAAALMRPHQRLRDAHAHTRLVNLAKVALPALAAATLGLILIWPLFTGGDGSKAGPEAGSLEMVGARYVGVDTTARPFEVRAQTVQQTGNGGSMVDLGSPEAEITLKGGTWLNLKADRGRYDQTSGRLSLEGNVTLYHDGGYEFSTDQAELDTGKGLVWGNVPVSGQGPMGHVDAGGFRILDDGNTVVFTGRARLHLTGQGESGRPG
ncbi:LPS export ABC transporter periplasmic protein LptC [Oleisolibacter albus]|uniref:LPS export ABC transporter periplasmic protein LptC n=1 Tax=Oleisolibacter albus TaxID=2171757 RepID=UPI000DF3C6C5|nr:LPS export ABC transporter periplasmic protein LptC [Oleisolibacter albus]